MIWQLMRRTASLCITLLVASVVIFGSLYVAPGKPLNFLLGNRTVAPEAVQALRHEYFLDRPPYQRFFKWLGGVLHGNLGQSIIHQQPVTSLLAPRVGTTTLLLAYAAAIIFVVGIGLGVLAALRPGRTDTTVLFITITFISVPPFVAAIGLIALFSVQLGWFPVFGSGGSFPDRLYHLTLPAIALALMSTAYVARVARTALRAESESEHVQTAIGRGLPWRTVVRRHIFRNGLLQITTVAAVSLVSLLSSSVVIEEVFGLGGIGSLLVDSVQNRDFAVVQAICLIYVAAVVIISTAVDLSYVALDPRIRIGSR